MTKFLVLTSVIAIFSSSAFANSLECSNSKASLQVQAGQSEGGPGAGPGHKLSWSDVVIDGVKFEDVSYKFTKKKTLAASKTKMYISETFVAQVNVTAEDRSAEGVVLCDSAIYIGPPRP